MNVLIGLTALFIFPILLLIAGLITDNYPQKGPRK